MSLSRPATFPLLKLPFLCIEPVIKSWDIFDIIFFALTSKRTRQVVKHLKIPLNRIRIFLTDRKWIELDTLLFKRWNFWNEGELKLLFDEHQNLSKDHLVLQKNELPLYTSKTDVSLESYTDGNETNALKMTMGFLNEVFKCSVERVVIKEDNFPESGDFGVKSTVKLSIDSRLGYDRSQKLNLLLEKLEVTGTCIFCVTNTENGFFVDPKLFKCKQLMFCWGSADWVTKEILLQFEIPQLQFSYCPFSVEDILSFVTNWFHSDNKALEYLYIAFHDRQVSLEQYGIREFNPFPFSERNRIPPSRSFGDIDFPIGMELVRHDGLSATIHVNNGRFLFYIWHNQSAVTQS
ncbi:unnamed protein product [Caenorhabditis brenneri]